MAAAAQQNPSVLLSKERIEASKGDVTTQLGAMLPNLSANVRQSQQTQFLGTFGLAPVRTEPFSIFDARVSASQNLFSLSLIQRWRASREALQVAEFDAQSSRFDTMASTGLAYLEGVKAATALAMRQANQQLIREIVVDHARFGGKKGPRPDWRLRDWKGNWPTNSSRSWRRRPTSSAPKTPSEISWASRLRSG